MTTNKFKKNMKLSTIVLALALVTNVSIAQNFDIEINSEYNDNVNNNKFNDIVDAQLQNEIRLSKLKYVIGILANPTSTDQIKAQAIASLDDEKNPFLDGNAKYELYKSASGIGEDPEAGGDKTRHVIVGTGSTIPIDGENLDIQNVKGTTIAGKNYKFAGDTTIGVVTIGSNIPNEGSGKEVYRTITNVAAGRVTKDSTDGLNGSQLFATNQAIDDLNNRAITSIVGDDNILVSSGEKNAHTVSLNKNVSVDSVTTGDVSISKNGIIAGNKKITGVANGDINENSTDGINGGQLHTVKVDLKETQDLVDKGITFKDTDGNKSNIKLGGEFDIINSDKNVTTKITNDKISVDLAKDLTVNSVTTGDVSISSLGFNAGNKKVINVFNGLIAKDSKDGVNGGQLFDLEATLNTRIDNLNIGTDFVDEGITFKDTDGNKSNIKLGGEFGIINSDKNVTTKITDGKVSVDLAKDLTVDSVTTGDVSISKNGIIAGNKKITGVANGDINENSTDGINGGQLHTVKVDLKETQDLVDKGITFKDTDGNKSNIKLGGEFGIINSDKNVTTKITDGKISVDLAKDLTVDSVTTGDVSISKNGIIAGNKKITGVANGDINENSTDGINGGQLHTVKVDLKETQDLVDKGITFKDTNGNKSNIKLGGEFDIINTDKNVTTQIVENKISVDLAKDLEVESVKTGDVLISVDGINAGNKVIINVEDGKIEEDSKEAINGGQLFALLTEKDVNAPLIIDGDSGETYVSKLNTVKISGDTENISTKTSETGLIVELNKDIAVDSINVGGIVINNDGINANDTKVVNMADGEISAESKDGVNGGQLFTTNQAIGDLDTKVAENRKISSQGIASVAAMDIEYPEQRPGQWATGVGVGHYDGEQAIGIGSNFLTENGKYKVAVSYGQALSKGSKPAAKASVGWVW